MALLLKDSFASTGDQKAFWRKWHHSGPSTLSIPTEAFTEWCHAQKIFCILSSTGPGSSTHSLPNSRTELADRILSKSLGIQYAG